MKTIMTILILCLMSAPAYSTEYGVGGPKPVKIAYRSGLFVASLAGIATATPFYWGIYKPIRFIHRKPARP